jgi:hypothetical protein
MEVKINPKFDVEKIGDENSITLGTDERITLGVTIESRTIPEGEAILFSDRNRIGSKMVESKTIEFTRKFQKPGERNVEIQVLGAAGESESESWEINVKSENPEIRSITPTSSRIQIKPGITEEFSVETTEDAENDIIYRWEIDGSASGSGDNITHTFSKTGNHSVSVEVARKGSETVTSNWDVFVYPFNSQIDISDQTSVVQWDGNASTETFTFTVQNPLSNEHPAITEIDATTPDGVEISAATGSSSGSASKRIATEKIQPGDILNLRIQAELSEDVFNESDMTNKAILEIPYEVTYYPKGNKENKIVREQSIRIENEKYSSDDSPVRGHIIAMLLIFLLSHYSARVK